MTVGELRRAAVDPFAGSRVAVESDAIRMELARPRAAINLRGRPGDAGFIAAIRGTGIRLPVEPNTWAGDDERAAIWLGPDEWLVVAPDGEAATFEAAVRAALPGDPWLSLVDLSHNYTTFLLSGSRVRDLLAKGCPLDLHPKAFRAGCSAQTMLAKSSVLLRALEDGGVVEIWLRNSFADYTARWLLDAATEFLRE
ncbi:MAG TPA: sarcosine oxidase subunit gamma family protein [Woeseiaceae bacterium]|nr:sarcosine oxidase subunit gamma family protein [Woeseiaceae bacterium]